MSNPIPPHAACPPAALLEAHSVGESLNEPYSSHVATCNRCQASLATLRQEQEAFLKRRPAGLFLRTLALKEQALQKPTLSPWQIWGAIAVTAALLAMVALWSMKPAITPAESALAVREKGSPFRVVVKRVATGRVEPLHSEAVLHPGDSVRFGFSAPRDGFLLIFELEKTGAPSVFFPYQGDRAAPISSRFDELLPDSVVLDDTLGDVWLLAVFSPSPISAAEILPRIRRDSLPAFPVCDQCEVRSLHAIKQP